MKKRIKSLIYKMLSLSFLSWLAIYIVILIRGVEIDLEFYIFTACVMGIKTYKAYKEKLLEVDNEKD